MFTGIVEATGDVVAAGDGRLRVRAPLLDGAAIGASVAVSGICLTVTERDGDTCTFDLSAETLARTTLGSRRREDRVNLERPARAGAELGGHIVQGHVDGRAVVRSFDGSVLRVRLDAGLGRYVVEKGSVTLDGVSLTATDVTQDGFAVALVPHTCRVTTLGMVRPGDVLNVEVDVLAKYVEKLLSPWIPADEG